MENAHSHYYVPEYSKLPILTAIGLFCLGFGTLNLLHANAVGIFAFFIGSAILAGVMFMWFREVIREHRSGSYNDQTDGSFRWGIIRYSPWTEKNTKKLIMYIL